MKQTLQPGGPDAQLTDAQRATRLAKTFPCLRGKPGVEPWDVIELLRWTMVASHGEALAAKFVLSVWNSRTDWGVVAVENKILEKGRTFGYFDLFEAMHCMDEESIAAIAAWTKRPFFL